MTLNTRLSKVEGHLRQTSGELRIFVQYVKDLREPQSERFAEGVTDALYERAQRDGVTRQTTHGDKMSEEDYTDLRARMNTNPCPSEVVESLTAEAFLCFMGRCGYFVTPQRVGRR